MKWKFPATRQGKWVLCLFILLAVWGLTDVRKRAHLDPKNVQKHRTDFTVYTEAGAAFFDGRDPYKITNPKGWRYLYPPLLALVVSPLHMLDTKWQGMIWFFLSLSALWGCFSESERWIRLCHSGDHSDPWFEIPSWIRWGTCISILFPTLNCLQRGQMGIILLYFLLLGFRWIWTGGGNSRFFAGGMILVLPGVLKVTPFFPAGCVLLQVLMKDFYQYVGKRSLHRLAFSTSGFVTGFILLVFVFPSAVIGWKANLKHLDTWIKLIGSSAVHVRSAIPLDNPYNKKNQSLENAIHRLGNWVAHTFFNGPDDEYYADWRKNLNKPMHTPGVRAVVLALRIGTVLLWIGAAFRLARRSDSLSPAMIFGLACVVSLIVSPVSRGHYFVLEWPAVFFVSLWFWKQNRDRISQILAITPAVVSLLFYGLLPLSGRLGILGLGTFFWYLAVVGWILVHNQTRLNPVSEGLP